MPNLNYADISYEGLVTQLKNKLKEKDAWKDTYASSTGTTLIELMAYSVNVLMFYLQRTFEEHFVDLAKYWTSLVRMSKLVDYSVARPSGSSGVLRFTAATSLTNPITIPRYTVISDANNTLYYTDTVADLSVGGYVDVAVRQGSKQSRDITAIGGDFQEYNIGSITTTNTDIKVILNDTQTLTKVGNFLQVSGTGYYETNTELDGSLNIKFGTSSIGGAPTIGTKITVEYYNVKGKASNMFDSTMNWYSNILNTSISLISSFVGGDDIEDIASLKRNIPVYFAAGQRGVTIDDYKILVDSLSGIRKILVKDVKDSFGFPFREVHIFVIPEGGYTISPSLKSDIDAKLAPRSMTGIAYLLKDALIREVDILAQVKIKAGYNTSVAKSAILAKLTDMYDVANLEFGQWIDILTIQNAILNIDGVYMVNILLPALNIINMYSYEFLKLKDISIETSY